MPVVTIKGKTRTVALVEEASAKATHLLSDCCDRVLVVYDRGSQAANLYYEKPPTRRKARSR